VCAHTILHFRCILTRHHSRLLVRPLPHLRQPVMYARAAHVHVTVSSGTVTVAVRTAVALGWVAVGRRTFTLLRVRAPRVSCLRHHAHLPLAVEA
jgi:hypothetical protein